jgi:hypothetical protein
MDSHRLLRAYLAPCSAHVRAQKPAVSRTRTSTIQLSPRLIASAVRRQTQYLARWEDQNDL